MFFDFAVRVGAAAYYNDGPEGARLFYFSSAFNYYLIKVMLC